jgi:hypothetical protein
MAVVVERIQRFLGSSIVIEQLQRGIEYARETSRDPM